MGFEASLDFRASLPMGFEASFDFGTSLPMGFEASLDFGASLHFGAPLSLGLDSLGLDPLAYKGLSDLIFLTSGSGGTNCWLSSGPLLAMVHWSPCTFQGHASKDKSWLH